MYNLGPISSNLLYKKREPIYHSYAVRYSVPKFYYYWSFFKVSLPKIDNSHFALEKQKFPHKKKKKKNRLLLDFSLDHPSNQKRDRQQKKIFSLFSSR